MYCVYRIKIEEYRPGFGWADDGCIYSLDKVKLEEEAQRRVMTTHHDHERVRSGKMEIVIVHETFLRDLKTTPVLSTLEGTHPADEGTLLEHKDTFKYMNTPKRQGNTSVPSAVR
jgi:hypothetical protein